MLYLEDYLELIEHLPQELRDRLTLIRENDLKVNNTSSQIDTKVKQFFAEARNLSPEQRQCDYKSILNEYEKTAEFAEEKVQLSDQTHEIMIKLIQRLDGELEKFKLELEADHAGITEELEKRSLELDADTRLDETIKHHLNGSTSHKYSLGFKDRRRSEHKQNHRYHPYQHNNNHHQDNGYHARAKLSQNHQQSHDTADGYQPPSINKLLPHHGNRKEIGRFFNQYNPHSSQDYSNNSSPSPFGNGSLTSSAKQSAPASMSGEHMNGTEMDLGGHHGSNMTSFGNSGFKYKNKNHNSSFNQRHSALSAALSSATVPTPQSKSNSSFINSSSIQNNKISTNTKGHSDLIDPDSPLVRQNPLAAAASQAIAATQQLHQGRHTSSLKASFAAINGAGLADSINCKEGRNALAPMTPDQQACRFNESYGKLKSNGNASQLYVSVTKSGRPSKRPKHHSSHLYPDESPPSISSDNSVFENSESMSSADFIDAGNTFSSSSFECHDGSRFSDQSDGVSGGFYHQPDQTKYCICRQISYGEMVACDNEDCDIEWFHYGCVGISSTPKGKWFCPECTRKMDAHQQHLQNSSSQQTQTHKKRGRKEILGN